MGKYQLTNQAVEDLSNIWIYTLNEWSEKQADKYYNSLLNDCQVIANNPQIGKHYDGIRIDLFGYNSNHHIVFYRIVDSEIIEITRILHQRMDLKKRITE